MQRARVYYPASVAPASRRGRFRSRELITEQTDRKDVAITASWPRRSSAFLVILDARKEKDEKGRSAGTKAGILRLESGISSAGGQKRVGIYARRDSFAIRPRVIYRDAGVPRGDAGKQADDGAEGESEKSFIIPRINFPARVITEQRLLKRNGCCI